ncbi:hypothetical protein SAMN05216167_1613 [Spirosoma endophyticum]|uniref:Uncharacterized protein n=1 Tax=Spirosoma endophyticum TaxID=662367 RepID=A0A1I2ID06_9BACT|nr:hypothetical protein SAMN05216167_1613 [Spirosoma endophyticum]
MEKLYRTSSYLFIAVMLMVFVGFYKTYFGLFPHFDGITLALHIHAVTILAWMSILIIQPFLIRGKKLELHRLIGKISYVVMPLVVLSTGWIMRLVDLQQNTGQISKPHFDIACYNSRKGKGSLTPNASAGDCTARAAPQISMYSKTACLAVA